MLLRALRHVELELYPKPQIGKGASDLTSSITG